MRSLAKSASRILFPGIRAPHPLIVDLVFSIASVLLLALVAVGTPVAEAHAVEGASAPHLRIDLRSN